MLEFAEAWQSRERAADPPGEHNRDARMADIRKRVQRIADLVGASELTEAAFTHSNIDDRYADPRDYFNAVRGTIRAAEEELGKLQKLLNGTPEPPAEGGGAHE